MKQKSLVRGFVTGTVFILALAGASASAEETGSKSVQSLNGLKGKLTLAAGTGTSVTTTNSKTLIITGLVLPYSGSVSSNTPAFKVVNNVPSGYNATAFRAEVWASGVSSGTAIEAFDFSGSPYGTALTASSDTGLAGSFWGNVDVAGTLSKSAGSFKIDHPLDPENKFLYHSFVESPDMKNIYDGTVVLDDSGGATVELPEWFEALNRDFRYQLTCVGEFAPVFVRDEVLGNRFTIAGGFPGMRVCWQVTGTRQDPFANAHRIPVEEDKSAFERGYYLHPDAYGQPDEHGIQWAQRPDLMRLLRDSQK